MTPVFQTTFGNGADPEDKREPGNCLQAALASILDLPLDAVPNFAQWFNGGGNYMEDHLQPWLASHGLFLIWAYTSVLPSDYRPAGIHLMGGVLPGGTAHVVVALEGVCVHDPSPRAEPFAEVSEYGIFVALDPAKVTA